MARKDDDIEPDELDDDTDVDETDDDDDDESGDDLADMTDAELRDELKKTRDQLTRVNGQSAKRRKALRDKERELIEARKPKPVKKADDTDAEKPDLDAVREEAKREARAEADDRIKRSEAKAALVSAGVSRDQASDLVGFVKLADLDIDDDGEIDGLDDEIDRIKKKYPTFFAQKRTRRASIAGDGKSSSDNDRRKPLDASAAQAALLTGKTRR